MTNPDPQLTASAQLRKAAKNLPVRIQIRQPAAHASARDDDIDRNRDTDFWRQLERLRGEQPALFMVGFAAETENLAENARGKLARKRLQMVAGNLVGDGRAFDREDNTLTLFTAEDAAELGSGTKRELAGRMVERIAEAYDASQSAGTADARR